MLTEITTPIKAVCVYKGSWRLCEKGVLGFIQKHTPWLGRKMQGPVYHQIVYVIGIGQDGYLLLSGYEKHGRYTPAAFRPFNERFADRVLANIEQQIKEEFKS